MTRAMTLFAQQLLAIEKQLSDYVLIVSTEKHICLIFIPVYSRFFLFLIISIIRKRLFTNWANLIEIITSMSEYF